MQQYTNSAATKKLILRFILENVEVRKRSAYLQDIIFMSKMDIVWNQALLSFFNIPLPAPSMKSFCMN